MTAERFNTLSFEQQGYYTVKCGAYLTSCNDAFFSIDLYQINDYYVEFFYRHGETECCMARAFCNMYELNRYLENISIEDLL
jgi:hypothetical protein